MQLSRLKKIPLFFARCAARSAVPRVSDKPGLAMSSYLDGEVVGRVFSYEAADGQLDFMTWRSRSTYPATRNWGRASEVGEDPNLTTMMGQAMVE